MGRRGKCRQKLGRSNLSPNLIPRYPFGEAECLNSRLSYLYYNAKREYCTDIMRVLRSCISMFNVQYNFNFISVKLYLYDYNNIIKDLVRYPSAFHCSTNCIVSSIFVEINYT